LKQHPTTNQRVESRPGAFVKGSTCRLHSSINIRFIGKRHRSQDRPGGGVRHVPGSMACAINPGTINIKLIWPVWHDKTLFHKERDPLVRGQLGIPDACLQDGPGKDELGTLEANGLLAPRFSNCPVPRNAANESVRGKFNPHHTNGHVDRDAVFA
jgi:hypothetical protein